MAITVVFEITEGMLWESSAGREERNWIRESKSKMHVDRNPEKLMRHLLPICRPRADGSLSPV